MAWSIFIACKVSVHFHPTGNNLVSCCLSSLLCYLSVSVSHIFWHQLCEDSKAQVSSVSWKQESWGENEEIYHKPTHLTTVPALNCILTRALNSWQYYEAMLISSLLWAALVSITWVTLKLSAWTPFPGTEEKWPLSQCDSSLLV